MKKIFSILLCFVMILMVTSIGVAEEFVPSVAGDLLETDIGAFINGCKISSYNVNGYTAIFASDLEKYGFLVDWNEQMRTVTIKRTNETEFSGKLVFGSENITVGKKNGTAYYTNIRTVADNVTVISYNINGKTAVLIDCLNIFGTVVFDSEKRQVECTIDNLIYKPLVTITDSEQKEEEKAPSDDSIDVFEPSASQEENGDYYKGGVLPSYSAITGAKLINKNEHENGFVSYTYENYDEFMADKYVTEIVSNEGFSFKKTDQNETSIIYYYAKEGVAVAIEINSVSKNVTLTFKE